MARPKFEPTLEHRRSVEAMAAYGIDEVKIARIIGVDPKTLRKHFRYELDIGATKANAAVGRNDEAVYITEEYVAELEAEMLAAADALEFERAATLRDRIEQMRESIGKKVGEVELRATGKDARGMRRKGGARVPRPKRA